MQCEFLTPDDDRWASLLSRVTHDFYHLPGYLRMCARRDNGEPGAFYVCEGRREFLLPLIVRQIPDLGVDSSRGWRDATSPYGYPGPLLALEGDRFGEAARFTDEALQAVLQAMRERCILTTFVRFHPLLDTPREPFAARGQLVMHGNTVSVDLTRSAEEIWANVRRNHKTEIIALERRAGLRGEEDLEWADLPAFIAAYRATMERVQAASFYYFDAVYFAQLRGALGSSVHLMRVRDDGQFVAGAIATECCGIVQYHLAATNAAFMKYRPQKLLCRDTWLWAQRRGASAFHLGGGVGGQEDGVYRFKSGFSDLRHPFYTWRACAEPSLYEQLVAHWRAQCDAAGAASNFFPAYRQPKVVQAAQ